MRAVYWLLGGIIVLGQVLAFVNIIHPLTDFSLKTGALIVLAYLVILAVGAPPIIRRLQALYRAYQTAKLLGLVNKEADRRFLNHLRLHNFATNSSRTPE